ncbi:coiled-coil domain-containing protein 136 isoform X7 [Anolis carolinensis]|uniref:coiled-coil domain-containing protein 136 isoform X7 n=1 Tax=Anolis carolinensis TaxID=28377 RepID=UPI002F2B79C6
MLGVGPSSSSSPPPFPSPPPSLLVASGAAMEAAGMQLPSSRRKDGAGEVVTSNTEVNEEEEEDEEDEEEEEEEEEEEGEGVPVKNLGSLDDDDEDDKASDLSDQELDQNLRAQVLQLLDDLEEARETALKHEDDSLELQGLLEDERLASAQQAEIFTKQIQRLQAQMRSLKDEYDSLQGVKDVELERVERELREANEEIHNLRLDAEEAAALHENEIAGLQEELCRLKAELDRVQQVRNEYDMEITALRAEINMKKSPPGTSASPSVSELATMSDMEEQLSNANEEVGHLQEELQTLKAQYHDLSDEYQILQESNRVMVHQLERLEAIKYKTRSKSESESMDSDSEPEQVPVDPSIRRVSIARRNTLRAGASVSFKSVEVVGTSSTEGEEKMEKLEEEDEYDLENQLMMEEEKVELVQAQYGPDSFSLSSSIHRGWRAKSRDLTEGELAGRKASEPDEPVSILCNKESQRSHTDRKTRVKDLKEGETIDLRKGMERGPSKCNQARNSLREMESKCRLSQSEWEQLHEELRLCKEEIERLNGTIPIGGRAPRAPEPPVISLPFIGLVVIVALLWCWWAETSS